MAKKITCRVTGESFYVTDDRWNKLMEKYDGDLDLYVSNKGKRLLKENGGDTQKAQGAASKGAVGFTNKIKCNVTGQYFYISPARRERLSKKFGSAEMLEKNWVSKLGITILQERGNVADIATLKRLRKLNGKKVKEEESVEEVAPAATAVEETAEVTNEDTQAIRI